MHVYVKWSAGKYEASKNGGQMFSLADMEVQIEIFLALSLIILQFFLIAVCRKYVLLIQKPVTTLLKLYVSLRGYRFR